MDCINQRASFTEYANYLQGECGYAMYTDPFKQDKAKEFKPCPICDSVFSVISFAKNNSYRHFLVCDYCGAWEEI